MKKVPIALIYSRIIIGITILIIALSNVANYSILAITLLIIGLLTDILDGIIARRIGISSEKLRRLDSLADQVFWIMIAIATFVQCPEFFKSNSVKLILLLCAEGLIYLISYLKFKKEVATHAISSKIWTLILFATLIQIMSTCKSGILFELCFYAGIITRLEIIAIILILRKWTTDVPTVYHAIRLRNGKSIKRHKLFNG